MVSHLSDDVPNVEFEIAVINSSVYDISAEDAKSGYVVFNKQRLNGNNLELISNSVKKLKPGQRGKIKLRQQLIPAEVTLLTNGLEDDSASFYFSNLNIYVVGEEGFSVDRQRLSLSDAIPARDAAGRLKVLESQYGSEISRLRTHADTIYRLSILYGMAMEADHIINFFRGSLSQEQVQYLDAHINSGIHNTLGTRARDNYYERMPPAPNTPAGQASWIRSHCAGLKSLIEYQQQLVSHKT